MAYRQKQSEPDMRQIEIPAQWFVRLHELKELSIGQLQQMGITQVPWLVHLFGYIESIKGIVHPLPKKRK